MTRSMKRVVVSSGLHEADIRPPALMTEFKRLSIRDASEFFADPGALVEVACPACGTEDKEPVFKKNEFLYNQCRACATVYVSPRPSAEALNAYYATSSASRFRVEHFSRDTAKARRYHLLRSHANWMGQIVDETGSPGEHSYADIQTHSPQVFDEIHALHFFSDLYSADPLIPVEGNSEAPVKTTTLSALNRVGALSAFEKIEHQFSPASFLETARGVLSEGGILFFTTRSISGFDLQVLWDKTPYIFVPEHLNLLSVEGIGALLERSGFELIELSTPGQLDLEFVLHAARQDPTIKLPQFVRYLIEHRDEFAHADFQEYLQKHRLSSHVRVAARKNGA